MITWFDILVHQGYPTAIEGRKMVFLSCCTSATCPAKFILAEGACHMIAALVLFDSSAAHGAQRHYFLVLFSPTLQLLIHSIFAGDSRSMPLISTPEAHPGVTGLILKFFSFTAFCTHM